MWIDPDGASLTLQAKWETSNRYAPPVEWEEDGVPGQPGMRFRAVRHGLKEFTQTVWITGTTESDLRTQIRNMVAVMDPTRGQGILRVTAPGGDQRQIRCYYSGGLGLSEALGGDSGILFQRVVLSFRAHEPYWEAISATSQTFDVDAPTGNFFSNPFLPIRLSSTEISVDATVTNAGDVDAWPIIQVTAPGNGIKVINYTVGKSIYLPDYNLSTGEITIDTRPGYKTVIKDSTENLWPYVSATSALWPLRRGANVIRVEMGNAGYGFTTITISYTTRYLSP